MLSLRLWLFCACWLAFLPATAQLSNQPNEPQETAYSSQAIYIEIFGSAGYYSLNYERMIVRKGMVGLRGRIGGAALPYVPRGEDLGELRVDFYMPWSVNAFLGRRHQLEVGIGQTWFWERNPWEETYDFQAFPIVAVGWRKALSKNKFFRINALFIHDPSLGKTDPFMGVALGKQF